MFQKTNLKRNKNNKESVERWANGRYIQTIHIRGNQTGPETWRGRASPIIRNYRGAPLFFLPIRLAKWRPRMSRAGKGMGKQIPSHAIHGDINPQSCFVGQLGSSYLYLIKACPSNQAVLLPGSCTREILPHVLGKACAGISIPAKFSS